VTDREARLNALRDEAAGPGAPSTAGGYYGRPLLKPPVWTWEVPIYFFAGGTAGVAAMIAAAGAFTGADATLVRDARWVAAAGALLSPLLLISDLGRPSRFLNMMRVFKSRSPMSVGAWTLMLFAPAVLVPIVLSAIGVDIPGAGVTRWIIGAADLAAALTGLVLATYTGVLISVSAIPVWTTHARMLPWHFGVSSLGAAASIVELCGHRAASLNAIALFAAGLETAMGLDLERRRASPTSPLAQGRGGVLVRSAAVLSGPLALALRLSGGYWILGRPLAGVCAIAGSLVTRFGWIEAGRRSAGTPGTPAKPAE
jgi:hypothetical protein